MEWRSEFPELPLPFQRPLQRVVVRARGYHSTGPQPAELKLDQPPTARSVPGSCAIALFWIEIDSLREHSPGAGEQQHQHGARR